MRRSILARWHQAALKQGIGALSPENRAFLKRGSLCDVYSNVKPYQTLTSLRITTTTFERGVSEIRCKMNGHAMNLHLYNASLMLTVSPSPSQLSPVAFLVIRNAENDLEVKITRKC
jgi:hypothetical protein